MRTRVCAHAVLSLVVLTSFGCGQEPAMKAKPSLYDAELLQFLERDNSVSWMQSKRESYRKAPAYQAIACEEFLLGYLLNEASCATKGYRWQEGTHDLNRVAGRAAWLIEAVYEVILPPVRPDGPKNELQTIHRDAAKSLAAYRAGMMKLANEDRNAKRADVLREQYKSKIQYDKPGQAIEAANSMDEFLREWFPIGKEAKLLEEIIGKPSERRKGDLHYRFDTGEGGNEYQFIVKDGRIQSVHVVGLY